MSRHYFFDKKIAIFNQKATKSQPKSHVLLPGSVPAGIRPAFGPHSTADDGFKTKQKCIAIRNSHYHLLILRERDCRNGGRNRGWFVLIPPRIVDLLVSYVVIIVELNSDLTLTIEEIIIHSG